MADETEDIRLKARDFATRFLQAYYGELERPVSFALALEQAFHDFALSLETADAGEWRKTAERRAEILEEIHAMTLTAVWGDR